MITYKTTRKLLEFNSGKAIYIPKEVREMLNLDRYDTVSITVVDDKIVIEPVTDDTQ